MSNTLSCSVCGDATKPSHICKQSSVMLPLCQNCCECCETKNNGDFIGWAVLAGDVAINCQTPFKMFETCFSVPDDPGKFPVFYTIQDTREYGFIQGGEVKLVSFKYIGNKEYETALIFNSNQSAQEYCERTKEK